MVKKSCIFILLIILLSGCQNNQNISKKIEALNLPFYDIELSVNAIDKKINVHLSLSIKPDSDKLILFINNRAEINSIEALPKAKIEKDDNAPYPNLKRIIIHTKTKSQIKFSYSLNVTEKSIKGLSNLKDNSCYLDPEDGWYPLIDSDEQTLFLYELKAIVPESFSSVSEGKIMEETQSNIQKTTTIKAFQPVETIHFIASPFHVQSIEYNNIKISTYFLRDNKKLSDQYLNYAKKYLEHYEELIAPYPFPKLDIIESPYQVGYAMSSFTVIGSRILHLPFIVKTSLGHEILHNWWGNSVLIDTAMGNWCEALSTYLADYRYEELSSKANAIKYRRDIAKNFNHYVYGENDIPLSLFKYRYDRASSTIGYGKGMMVFHQLRLIIGDKLFFSGLQSLYKNYQYKYLSWKEIEKHFSNHSKRDLKAFFIQWVKQKGAPTIQVSSYQYNEKAKALNIKLSQKNSEFIFNLPIYIKGKSDHIQYIPISKKIEDISIPLNAKPNSFHIDPYFDVFRRPDPKEIPITLSHFFSANLATLLKYNKTDLNKKLVESLKELKSSSTKANPKLIQLMTDYDKHQKQLSDIDKAVIIEKGSIIVQAKKHPDNDLTLIYITKSRKTARPQLNIYCPAKKLPERLSKRLPHYQNSSYLLFKGDKLIAKGEFEAEEKPYLFKIK